MEKCKDCLILEEKLKASEAWKEQVMKGMGSDKWLPEEMAKMQEQIDGLEAKLKIAVGHFTSIEDLNRECECTQENDVWIKCTHCIATEALKQIEGMK